MKTNELSGVALDWAVAKCEVKEPVGSFLDGVVVHPDYNNFHPSRNWAQGGEIIEREGINLDNYAKNPQWSAWAPAPEQAAGEAQAYGTTPLEAAMRCYVASKLGDEVEIPETLK